ncbi:AmmeMemoRadiSam system protein A [Thiomicrorhabdus cannonii]|uniref:AmmeMemoRadiSam system protein A n=1 Tax=Thiomicrorhabdus cannonii TaxID=2748011 RepID=UPI0015BC1F89|nr:AmmeMemoRadiSam system protein A [Thiomicrorhabdus cannonii]
MQLNEQQQQVLLSAAKSSIQQAWSDGEVMADTLLNEHGLMEHGASFVTLNKHNQLRGCIGTLQAMRPLAKDVVYNAFNAAFRDPRFSPLQTHEVASLEVEISALSQPEPMHDCDSKEALLEQLRPFEDGLILTDGYKRSTFLPSVWEQLPDKQAFVDYLLRKGGMTAWSETMRCERYTTFKFGAHWHDINT